MVAEQLRFQSNPEVIDTVLDENEATLMHLETKLSYALNGTALRIWGLLKQGCTIDEIAEKIHDEFDVRRERVIEDATKLIEDLLAFKLIVPIK